MNASLPQQPPQGGVKLIMVSMSLALVAVIMVNFYILRVKQQVQEEQFPVYKLTRDIRPGDRIQARDVETVMVPKKFEAAMRDIGVMDSDAKEQRVLAKREVKRYGSQGQLLTYDLFDETNVHSRPQPPDGMRQITLPINSRFQSGNLRPGDFVDIVAPFDTGGRITESLVVMERVRVIALGTQTLEEEETGRTGRVRSYHTITIEVKPDVAKDLSMIQRLVAGDFELHLRRSDDFAMINAEPDAIAKRVKDILKQRLAAGPAPAGQGGGGNFRSRFNNPGSGFGPGGGPPSE